MGLFSRKKKELPERNLPEFPKFPELPNYNQETKISSSIPTYESEFKREVQERKPESVPSIQPQQNTWERPQPWTREQNAPQESERQEPVERRFDIPARQQPSYEQSSPRPEFRIEDKPYRVASSPPITRFEPDVWKPPREEFKPREEFEERKSQSEQVQTQASAERPVFVKIQQYREAMTSIEVLKQKLKEVENILDRVTQIRNQEQTEITNCQNNLNKIKDKLIEIDKKLFEV